MSVLAKAAKIDYKLGRDKRYKRMGAKGVTGHYRRLPRQPSSVIVAGPSGSGKSELVGKWLRYLNVFQVKTRKIVYAYDR